MFETCPDDVKYILRRLDAKGYQVFIVGGCCRDYLLGKEPNDYDITTNATPDQVISSFPEKSLKLVGESFGVVIVDGIEVATFRKDRYTGSGDDNLTVEYTETIQDDLSRRDLTCNSIACRWDGETDSFNDYFVDPFDGQLDIKNKVVRFVGNALTRIDEDPNRVIRACRFLALFGEGSTFIMDDVFTMTQFSASAFRCIAPERIHKELLKACKYPNTSIFFKALHDIGILKFILPELDCSFGLDGGNHHPETVWEHQMDCGDSMSCDNPLLKLTGYLHDYGKPDTYDVTERTFYNHHYVGSKLLRYDLTKLKFPNHDIDYMCGLVDRHLEGPSGFLSSPRATRRFISRLDKSGISFLDWYLLYKADHEANRNPCLVKIDENQLFEDYSCVACQGQPVKVNELSVNGKDVMDILGIPQGREIGVVLKKLFDFSQEYGITDRDELLNELQAIKNLSLV